MRNPPHHLSRLPRKLLVTLISVYQATLSPDHGALRTLFPYGYCRHEPTCSAFGKQVILERGVVRGMLLLLRRLLSCHPWARVNDAKWRALAERMHGHA